jgi:hypothetical protein
MDVDDPPFFGGDGSGREDPLIRRVAEQINCYWPVFY